MHYAGLAESAGGVVWRRTSGGYPARVGGAGLGRGHDAEVLDELINPRAAGGVELELITPRLQADGSIKAGVRAQQQVWGVAHLCRERGDLVRGRSGRYVIHTAPCSRL